MNLLKKLILVCLIILPLLLTVSCNPFADDDDSNLLTQSAHNLLVDFFGMTEDADDAGYDATRNYMFDETINSGWTLVEDTEVYCKMSNGDGITYTEYYGDGDRFIMELDSYDVDGAITITGEDGWLSVDSSDLSTYTSTEVFSFTIQGWTTSSIQGNIIGIYDYNTDEPLSYSGSVTIDGKNYDVRNMIGFL